MSASTLAQRLAVTGVLPRMDSRAEAPLRIGFLVPLSGRQQSWGQPGLDGARIWADGLNGHGGVLFAGRRHRVELIAHDSHQGEGATLAAAREMVERKQVRLVLALGGDNAGAAFDYLSARKVLTATLLPSDLSPDRPYLIAPAEVHPLFNVTGVTWLARNRPLARRIALCSQTDLLGLPSLAVYRAASEAAGLDIVAQERYAPEEGNADLIVAAMLKAAPDVLCWCSAAPPMVHALTKAAYDQGFTGEILCCTGDDYPAMIAQTSEAFMSRFTFQFPDFDDPALAETAFFFRRPKAFFDLYNERYPDTWSAVSWEYASVLDLWQDAVELSGTADPVTVLAAMKRGRQMPHAFGPARWWGETVFGIDNALVGPWPVVRLQNGRARIVEFASVLDWLDQHEALLQRHLSELGQLWHQRMPTRSLEPDPNLEWETRE